MRVYFMSDLHLEMGPLNIALPTPQNRDTDVLVLAGDICSLHQLDPRNSSIEAVSHRAVMKAFKEQVERLFSLVVIVGGNHDIYGSLIDNGTLLLRQHFPNAIILENDAIEINGLRFIGATLWSSFHNADPDSARACSEGMSDFSTIRKIGADHTDLGA